MVSRILVSAFLLATSLSCVAMDDIIIACKSFANINTAQFTNTCCEVEQDKQDPRARCADISQLQRFNYLLVLLDAHSSIEEMDDFVRNYYDDNYAIRILIDKNTGIDKAIKIARYLLGRSELAFFNADIFIGFDRLKDVIKSIVI